MLYFFVTLVIIIVQCVGKNVTLTFLLFILYGSAIKHYHTKFHYLVTIVLVWISYMQYSTVYNSLFLFIFMYFTIINKLILENTQIKQ